MVFVGRDCVVRKRGKRNEGDGVFVGVTFMNRAINILVVDLLMITILAVVALSGYINS